MTQAIVALAAIVLWLVIGFFVAWRTWPRWFPLPLAVAMIFWPLALIDRKRP